jgi:integrase
MKAHTIQNTESGKVIAGRDYLTEQEIRLLVDAAKESGRYGQRDALLLTMLYRHGLRTQELITMTWDQVMFEEGRLHVTRAKNGADSVQPVAGDVLRQLRALKKDAKSNFIFETERGGAMTTRNVRAIVARASEQAALSIHVHAHMLRHSCGYHLANNAIKLNGDTTRVIQDYLGHKNIQNTRKYTQLSAAKFKGIEKLFNV